MDVGKVVAGLETDACHLRICECPFDPLPYHTLVIENEWGYKRDSRWYSYKGKSKAPTCLV